MSELRGLQLSLPEFRARNARVVAVSVDPPGRNTGVIARLGLDFDLLSDAEGKALAAFDVRHAGGGPGGRDIARPATFIFEGGVLRWRNLTDNWRVRPRPATLLRAIDSLRE